MKKQLGTMLIGALVLTAGVSFAQDDTREVPERVRKNIRDQIEIKKQDATRPSQEERTALRMAAREETKKQIETIKKEAAEKRKGYVAVRLRQLIDIITKHQTRLESALAEAKTTYPALVTTEAQAKLDASKAALAEAKTHFEDLDELVISDENKDTVTAARELTKKAQEALKKAHKELVAGAKALKESIQKETEEDDEDEDETESVETTTN